MIQLGDVFTVGKHVLACGDLEKRHHEQLLTKVGVDRVGMVYVDPPWNQGLASNFRRQAGYEGKPDFVTVMNRVFEAAVMPRVVAYVEMGDQNQKFVQVWGRKAGFETFESWKIPYGDHFSWVTRMSCDPGISMLPEALQLAGKKGIEVPRQAIVNDSAQGTYVFDPCLGLGATLAACLKTDRLCLGMELNPERLATSIEKATKRTGEKPVFLGRMT